MKLTYHGHSVISVILRDGTRLLFDPFITGNALTDLQADTVETDYILVTHGHNDHVGDMISIAKRNDAMIISNVEICRFAEQRQVKKTHGLNIGGGFDFPFGRISLTYAQHSSSYNENEHLIYMGVAAGILLQAEGKTIFHAGDTADFSDLSLLAQQFPIDVAFLPIGDNFTMGPEAAIRAAKRLDAKLAVPIHYNTFKEIQQNPTVFTEALTGVGKLMTVGETIEV